MGKVSKEELNEAKKVVELAESVSRNAKSWFGKHDIDTADIETDCDDFAQEAREIIGFVEYCHSQGSKDYTSDVIGLKTKCGSIEYSVEVLIDEVKESLCAYSCREGLQAVVDLRNSLDKLEPLFNLQEK